MRVRNVLLAYVCTAFLAAPAAVSGAAAAEDNPLPPASLPRATSALVAGETTDAISAFSEAIESRELAPEQLANALLNRALAHQQAGEISGRGRRLHGRAEDRRARARSLGRRHSTIAVLPTRSCKQPALAIEDFTSALLLDPHFAHAYFSRGTVLRESGQYLFALSDYEKALRFNHPQAYLVHYGEGAGA